MRFLPPAYGERSLSDVFPAVAAAVGTPYGETLLRFPEAPSYVVFLVDGMGSELLRRHAHAAPYLSSLLERQQPGTAGVPSTTATSLTSLGTGLTPGAHGMVGYTSRIPGTESLLNALQWSKDVDPHVWQPHPTAFQTLGELGVPMTVVNKREFRGSGLTEASQRGAEYVGADKVGERIAAAMHHSSVPGSITYLYEGDLDWTGHRHGVSSLPWLQQLSIIDAEVEQLRDALAPATRLLVLADHGMIDSPPSARIDVDEHLELRDGLVLLGGEARFRHLYCQGGAVGDVVTTWREVLGERATVVTREEAIGAGWFGAVDPLVLPRLGDVLVAAHGDHAVMSSALFPYETTLVGLHGSMTPDEMLIPLLVC